MKTTIRLSAVALGCIALSVAATSAFADGKSTTTTAKAPSLYESIPKTTFDIPTKISVPTSIPKGESATGVFVEIPEYLRNNPQQGNKYVQVFASREDQMAYQQGTGSISDACFVSASPANTYGDEYRWSSNFSIQQSVAAYPRNYTYGPEGTLPTDVMNVGVLRSDRVTNVTSKKLTLESRIVGVDAQNESARVLSTQTAEFAFVKEMPGKVRIYAARTGEDVTFLVRRERHADERPGQLGSMFVHHTNSGSVSTSDTCHLTFSMPVRENSAATAVLQLETVLEITPMDDSVSDADMPPDPSLAGMKEVRLRPMQVGFSSTWLSSDAAPIVSLSHGWLGRERTQQM